MQAWWERDQIISAFIVGTFSMIAAMISMVVNSRRIETAAKKAAEAVAGSKTASRAAKKTEAEKKATSPPDATARRAAVRRFRRLRALRVGLMFVVGLVVGGVGYRVGSTTLSAMGLGFGSPLEAGVSATHTLPPLLAEAPAVRAGAIPAESAAALAAPPAAEIAPSRLSDWLRALGTRVYYRYAERLPGACAGAATVHGSWEGGDAGEPVRCVDSAWLAFDLAPLLESGRVVPDRVYCFNFRDETGQWAAHDAAGSPGLEDVAMAVPEGELGQVPLGLRAIRDGESLRITFATAAASAPC